MPVVTSDGMYEICGRRYIDIDNLQIKVPWRYNRVIGVFVSGLKTVHELKKDDLIKNLEFDTKTWNGETFYVLKSIEAF